jgi:hypothetical protein
MDREQGVGLLTLAAGNDVVEAVWSVALSGAIGASAARSLAKA